MRTFSKRIASAALGIALLSSAPVMTGCSLGGGTTNENGGTKTVASDRNEWTTIADSSGRVWSTVVRIEPSIGADLDEEKLVGDLRQAKTFDWIRVICSDNRATNKKEGAYLFLATGSDYGQIKNAVTELEKKGWSCSMLDVTTYESYTSSVNDGTYEYSETTYEK